MNVTHRQLAAFVAVARTRSFAEASGVVHLSQPALSIALKKLEDTVGGRLVARTTRAVNLTPEGEAFYPVAQRLLADWENAFDQLHQRFVSRRGRVALAAMPSFAGNRLPDIIRLFRPMFPLVNVSVHDVVAEEVVSLVRNGRVEFGVCFDPGRDQALRFEPMYNDRFMVVLPPGHELINEKSLGWQQLSGQELILLQRPSSFRQIIEDEMVAADVMLSPAFEAHQLTTVGRLVEAGLGVSIVPALCQQQMESMGAVCLPFSREGINRDIGILSRRGYPLTEQAQALINALKNYSWPESS